MPEERPDAGTAIGAPIRIVVADRHRLVREAVAAVLEGEADMAVVGAAADGAEALVAAARLRPDVLCLDVALPGLDALEVIRRVRRLLPLCGVVALSDTPEESHGHEAFQWGACAWVPKTATPRDLMAAVRAAAAVAA